jgi:hypothetical protein
LDTSWVCEPHRKCPSLGGNLAAGRPASHPYQEHCALMGPNSPQRILAGAFRIPLPLPVSCL